MSTFGPLRFLPELEQDEGLQRDMDEARQDTDPLLDTAGFWQRKFIEASRFEAVYRAAAARAAQQANENARVALDARVRLARETVKRTLHESFMSSWVLRGLVVDGYRVPMHDLPGGILVDLANDLDLQECEFLVYLSDAAGHWLFLEHLQDEANIPATPYIVPAQEADQCMLAPLGVGERPIPDPLEVLAEGAADMYVRLHENALRQL